MIKEIDILESRIQSQRIQINNQAIKIANQKRELIQQRKLLIDLKQNFNRFYSNTSCYEIAIEDAVKLIDEVLKDEKN